MADSTGVKRSEYKGETDVNTFMTDLIGLGDDTPTTTTTEENKQSSGSGLDLLDDVLGLGTPTNNTPSTNNDNILGDDTDDILGISSGTPPPSNDNSEYVQIPSKTVLSNDDAANDTGATGLEIKAAFQRRNQKLVLEFTITNSSSSSVSDFAIKFNKNSFGLTPSEAIPDINISSGSSKNVALEILVNENNSNKSPGMPILIDCALKTSLGIFVFAIPVMLTVLIVKSPTMVNVKELRENWKEIETEDSMYYTVKNMSVYLTSPSKIKDRLLDHNIVFTEEGRNSDGTP
jgi:hypothetical protein